MEDNKVVKVLNPNYPKFVHKTNENGTDVIEIKIDSELSSIVSGNIIMTHIYEDYYDLSLI